MKKAQQDCIQKSNEVIVFIQELISVKNDINQKTISQYY